MAFLEGKSPAEKKKVIAAAVLGVVSLVALYMAFGRSFLGGSSTTATTKGSPTPTPRTQTAANPGNQLRALNPENSVENLIVPVVYNPGNTYGAPDPGRNIFAFYEPPPPTPWVQPTPTPPPPPVIPTPTPVPTPPFQIASLRPASIYAGTKGAFKLEVSGAGFTPDARIYFNQSEMPTTFVDPQTMSTTIPEAMIAREGPKQVIIQTPDGRLYSGPFSLNVMPPPRPSGLQYIGMIARKRFNNDTAYFMEPGKQTPFGARLNDVVAGRFRIVDISASEVVVEDVTLGFRHRIAMTTTAGGPGGATPGGFVPYNPGQPANRPVPQPPRPGQRPPTSKDDVDDNDNP